MLLSQPQMNMKGKLSLGLPYMCSAHIFLGAKLIKQYLSNSQGKNTVIFVKIIRFNH